MNLYEIEMKANELNIKYPSLKKMLVIIAIVELLPGLSSIDYSSMWGYVLLGVILLTATFSHGTYVITKKVISNEELEGKEQYEGIKRIKELFMTYLLRGTIADVILIGGVAIIEFGAQIFFKDALVLMMDPSLVSQYDASILSQLWLFLFYYIGLVIAVFIFGIIFSISISMVPYVVEYQKIYNFKALKESMRLMKGHKREYVKMYLSFIFYYIVIGLVMIMCNTIFVSIPLLGTALGMIIGMIIEVNTFYPNLMIREALFYKKLVELKR